MATRRIIITGGINFYEAGGSATPNNMLCCVGCQYVTVQFQNVHNTALSITDFGISSGSSTDWNVSVSEINGNSPLYPFIIAQDQIIDVTFEICPPIDSPPADYWKFDITTIEHGNEGFYYIPMNCVTLADLISVTSIDFGTVPASTSPSTSFTFTNNTIGRIDYVIDIGGCAGLSGTDLTNTTYSGDVFTPTLTWAAGVYPDSISCTILITENNTGACTALEIPVTGIVEEIVCEEGACLCCVDIAVETVGGYLNTVNGLCDPAEVYNQSSFLDQKKVVFQMYYPSGIFSGWRLQFNPNLFNNDCVSPFETNDPLPVGYSIYYAASLMPNGSANNMTLNGAGSNQMNQTNYQVVFRPVDAAAGLFNVELTFFLIQDFNNFVDLVLFDNSLKLKRNVVGAATNYDNSFASVYNSNKVLQAAFFVTDPLVVVDGGFFKCSHNQCFGFTSRFYNKGLYNAASEFTAPLFTLERTAGTVSQFSTIEKTKVTFQVNVSATYGGANAILFHLFDETLVNQTQNFLLATDSSRANITNVVPISLLNNHLFTPSTFTPLFGGNYQCSAYVFTNINPASTYRIAAIVYANDGVTVNTFISEQIQVRVVPDQDCDCAPTIESTFNQYYETQQTDCLQPVAKERIRHILNLTEGDFGDCLAVWGLSPVVSDWRTLLTSVTLNIYKKRSAFPSATQTAFFIYEQHFSVRNNGFAGNWQNFTSLIVKDNLSGGIDTNINNRRVRFDPVPFSGTVLTANTATYMQRTNAGALASTYIATTGVEDSWVNDQVFFEYIFGFDFGTLFAQPYNLNLVRAFKVLAIDIETNNSGFPTIITDVLIEGKDKITGLYNEIETTFCADNYEDIRLIYQADQEGMFLFFAEKNPFGISTLQEHDEAPSALPLPLTQQTIAGVLYADVTFDPITLQAQVILSPTFFENNRYRLCGYISINPPEPTCVYFVFHQRTAGSTMFVFSSPQTGDTINGTFALDTTPNRFLQIVSTNGETVNPVAGTTYSLEYNFSIPTTRTLEFRMGTGSTFGATTFTLAAGATSGIVSFVWGTAASPEWNFKAIEGVAMTGTFQFKLGNNLCV